LIVALLLHFLVLIAFIETSCILVVVIPVLQTKPAEVEFTSLHLTFHVITTIILLNRAFAFWARLCICQDPSSIFRFTCVLKIPIFYNFTWTWSMGFQCAFKAELSSTLAIYIFDIRFLNFDTVFTTWFRTPLDIFASISERHPKPFNVSF
jgi:hypothetical protein